MISLKKHNAMHKHTHLVAVARHMALASPISGHFVAWSNHSPNCLIGSRETSWSSSKDCGVKGKLQWICYCLIWWSWIHAHVYVYKILWQLDHDIYTCHYTTNLWELWYNQKEILDWYNSYVLNAGVVNHSWCVSGLRLCRDESRFKGLVKT